MSHRAEFIISLFFSLFFSLFVSSHPSKLNHLLLPCCVCLISNCLITAFPVSFPPWHVRQPWPFPRAVRRRTDDSNQLNQIKFACSCQQGQIINPSCGLKYTLNGICTIRVIAVDHILRLRLKAWDRKKQQMEKFKQVMLITRAETVVEVSGFSRCCLRFFSPAQDKENY